MSDDGDKVTEGEERAWENFQRTRSAPRPQLMDALRRVAIPCLDCGNEIPVARLMAVPNATRCIHCAKGVEGRWTR